MAFFNEFPHTRTYDSDLGWLIRRVGENIENLAALQEWAATHKEEYDDLKDKVDGLIENLVDVIEPWDSSIAYHIFTIVSWEGQNYIAVQDVPIGTMITNTDYWVPANTVIEQINAIGTLVSDLQEEIPAIQEQLDVQNYFINVKEYNAVGDGVTDDTEAIQAALSVVGEAKSTVWFPDGVYMVSGPMNVSSNTRLLFDKNAIIKIVRTDNTWRRLSFSLGVYGSTNIGGYNGVHDVEFDGLTLDGNYNELFTATSAGGGNIGLSHCRNIVFRNCRFYGMVNDHYLDIAGCENVLIDNCEFSDITAISTGNYEAINLDYAWETGFPHFGTYDDTTNLNIVISHCKFHDLGENSPALGNHAGTKSNAANKYRIENNDFYNCAIAMSFYISAYDVAILNNTFSNSPAGTFYKYYINFTADASNSLLIANNTIRDINRSIIYIGPGGNDKQIIGNRISNSDYNGLAIAGTNVMISNNIIRSVGATSDFHPLYFNGVTNGVITSNTLSAKASEAGTTVFFAGTNNFVRMLDNGITGTDAGKYGGTVPGGFLRRNDSETTFSTTF